MVDRTDNDDLTAFDFVADRAPESHDDVDALDFSAPEADPVADSFDEEQGDAEPDPLDAYTHTVSNPSESVSVSALVDGSIRQVELSSKATEMSEEQLVDEILVLAHLARQSGLAGQRSYLEDSEVLRDGLDAIGLDSKEVVRDFVEGGMGLPTAQEVAAEQAEVFATRYAHDGD